MKKQLRRKSTKDYFELLFEDEKYLLFIPLFVSLPSDFVEKIISEISSRILQGLTNILQSISTAILSGLSQNLANTISSLFANVLDVKTEPLNVFIQNATNFSIEIGIIAAVIGFHISLALYALPLGDEFAARGRVGMIESSLAIVLLNLTWPLLNFTKGFFDMLTAAVKSSMATSNLPQLLAGIITPLLTPFGLIFLIFTGIILILTFTILIASFVFRFFAPLLFAFGLASYALPFISKVLPNKLIGYSILCFALEPLGWGALAVYLIVLRSTSPVISAFVGFATVLIIYGLAVDIAKSYGTAFPFLGTLQRATITLAVAGVYYITKGAPIVPTSQTERARR